MTKSDLFRASLERDAARVGQPLKGEQQQRDCKQGDPGLEAEARGIYGMRDALRFSAEAAAIDVRESRVDDICDDARRSRICSDGEHIRLRGIEYRGARRVHRGD